MTLSYALMIKNIYKVYCPYKYPLMPFITLCGGLWPNHIKQ